MTAAELISLTAIALDAIDLSEHGDTIPDSDTLATEVAIWLLDNSEPVDTECVLKALNVLGYLHHAATEGGK